MFKVNAFELSRDKWKTCPFFENSEPKNNIHGFTMFVLKLESKSGIMYDVSFIFAVFGTYFW